jgi:protein O-GlcNAc transferase
MARWYPAAVNAAAHQLQKVRDLLATGRAGDAVELARRLARARPTDAMVLAALGQACSLAGLVVQAQDACARAVALAGADPAVLRHVGGTLCTCGKFDEAIATLGRAVELDGTVESLDTLAAVCMSAGRLIKAEAAARRVLELDPAHTGGAIRAAASLMERGRGDRATEVLQEAIARNPGEALLREMLPPAMNYCGQDGAVILQAARDFAATVMPAAAVTMLAPRRDGQRMRIGFLSSDLKTHSVAYFLLPLLRHLPERAEVMVYDTAPGADGVSARLRGMVPKGCWQEVPGLGHDALAGRIAADGLSVLVDCNGLTVGHRAGTLAKLLTLAQRPVVLTWLGYPATTGLRLDGRLVDAVTDPGHADGWHSEPLVRLEGCFVCYEASVGSLPPRSAVNPAAVRFGSFNSLSKLSDRAVELMAGVLAAVPGSTLMLKAAALDDGGVRGEVLARFAKCGVAAERLHLLGRDKDAATHLARYGEVDVALDTTPYCGTTTTCEALTMGTPVVTLAPADGLHAARVGASVLRAAGFPELVAGTTAEFTAIAAGLAADAKRLDELHRTLPSRVRDSALCDGAAFAGRFVDAVEHAMQTAQERGR